MTEAIAETDGSNFEQLYSQAVKPAHKPTNNNLTKVKQKATIKQKIALKIIALKIIAQQINSHQSDPEKDVP